MTDYQFEEQIRCISRNDKDGLRQIYEAYHPLIYAVVLPVLGSRENAEDVTSEFFIHLWKIAHTYRFGQGHKAWLITIARNMAIDYLRKYGREQPVSTLPEPEPKSPGGYEDQLCRQISLKQALSTLKEEERQIVHLKIMGELTFREISALLKKPMGTVTWHYQTALKKLKRCGYEE